MQSAMAICLWKIIYYLIRQKDHGATDENDKQPENQN